MPPPAPCTAGRRDQALVSPDAADSGVDADLDTDCSDLACYAFEDAAYFSGSDWLLHFSYGGFCPARSSLTAVCLSGKGSGVRWWQATCRSDSSLWTMQIEFIGSVHGVWPGRCCCDQRYRPALGGRSWSGISPALIVWRPWYFPFILGLAACLAPLRGRELPAWLAIGLTIVALVSGRFLGSLRRARTQWGVCMDQPDYPRGLARSPVVPDRCRMRRRGAAAADRVRNRERRIPVVLARGGKDTRRGVLPALCGACA